MMEEIVNLDLETRGRPLVTPDGSILACDANASRSKGSLILHNGRVPWAGKTNDVVFDAPIDRYISLPFLMESAENSTELDCFPNNDPFWISNINPQSSEVKTYSNYGQHNIKFRKHGVKCYTHPVEMRFNHNTFLTQTAIKNHAGTVYHAAKFCIDYLFARWKTTTQTVGARLCQISSSSVTGSFSYLMHLDTYASFDTPGEPPENFRVYPRTSDTICNASWREEWCAIFLPLHKEYANLTLSGRLLIMNPYEEGDGRIALLNSTTATLRIQFYSLSLPFNQAPTSEELPYSVLLGKSALTEVTHTYPAGTEVNEDITLPAVRVPVGGSRLIGIRVLFYPTELPEEQDVIDTMKGYSVIYDHPELYTLAAFNDKYDGGLDCSGSFKLKKIKIRFDKP